MTPRAAAVIAPISAARTGPALKEQRFARTFAGKDLKTLFTKIATTMPRGAPGSLGDNVYLDIVAHLLKENGFARRFARAHRRRRSTASASCRAGPSRCRPSAISRTSRWWAVSTPGPQNTWMLTRASEPAVAVAPASATPAPAATATPLGTQTFHLLDAMAYAPADHRGQKMYVRGLLIKLPGEQRMTISAFETVSPTCGN